MEMPMKIATFGLAAIALAAFAAPVAAHHSFAMFDAEKTVTMNGTVTEFEWTNPHSWIHMKVADASGKELPWSIEMGSPAQQAQRGWRSDTVKTGDKVSVTIHPLKDGSRGGQFMSVVLPNGQTLGNQGRRPGAAAAE
jgi:hypothetical protein